MPVEIMPKVFLLLIFFCGVFLFGCASISGDDIDQPETDAVNYKRIIDFSSYSWQVKESRYPVGPGPNYFSASRRNVSLDEKGRLILAATERNGRWFCAEVICEESLGFGTYVFHVSASPARFDKQLVAGLFLYDIDPEYEHREIDIEFSRWGKEENLNSQYVVQPASVHGNKFRFDYLPEAGSSTHCIHWFPASITFLSYAGHLSPGRLEHEEPYARWVWKGPAVPPPGDEHVRINCYLYQGRPPLSQAADDGGPSKQPAAGFSPLSFRVDGFFFLKDTAGARGE